MEPGTILGHEGVGVVESIGKNVRNIKIGDRVIVSSTIACGYCSYCRAGYYSQCDNSNPLGWKSGSAFFGGPKSAGSFNGMQAEYVRVPFANIGLTKIPESVTDDQAVLLSDVFPTGYFAADIAGIHPGDTVAVFGAGPVGDFAIISSFLMGASRVMSIDHIDSRLLKAQELGAEIINFEEEDPVHTVFRLTGGIGVDKVIDAVGIDAEMPERGPARAAARKKQEKYEEEISQTNPKPQRNEGWLPGNAPSLALEWEVESLAKAGTLSIVGVYPENADFFPIGMAMNKNIRINMGNCPHRRYIPRLLNLIESKMVKPEQVLTQKEPFDSIISAYRSFNARQEGWIKVELNSL